MTKRDLSALFGMEPKEAIAFIRQKRLEPTWDYTEVWGEAHARTFTVAKIMKIDLLQDIHDSLQSAAKEGLPFKEWKDRLKPTLAAKGWYGRTEVFDPDTGEFKTITVGARRLKTIYETNMRSAYNHGRYIHLQKSGMPYWMYVSALLPTTRDAHRAMHGAVYPGDHPFWSANYPPNGYNCKCKVRGYTEAMLKKRGITPRNDYETIADIGFTHAPSASSLSQVWEKKILESPRQLHDVAAAQKTLSDRYDKLFAKESTLSSLAARHKPSMIVDQFENIENNGGYSIYAKTIYFKHAPDDRLLVHESAHAIDHALGFISAKLLSSIQKDVSAMRNQREEIKKMLIEQYDNDFYMHDLFYLSTDKWVGYKTRKDAYITDFNAHAEMFAIFTEIYLSSKKDIGIIKTYFPNSWRKFLRLLAETKDR